MNTLSTNKIFPLLAVKKTPSPTPTSVANIFSDNQPENITTRTCPPVLPNHPHPDECDFRCRFTPGVSSQQRTQFVSCGGHCERMESPSWKHDHLQKNTTLLGKRTCRRAGNAVDRESNKNNSCNEAKLRKMHKGRSTSVCSQRVPAQTSNIHRILPPQRSYPPYFPKPPVHTRRNRPAVTTSSPNFCRHGSFTAHHGYKVHRPPSDGGPSCCVRQRWCASRSCHPQKRKEQPLRRMQGEVLGHVPQTQNCVPGVVGRTHPCPASLSHERKGRREKNVRRIPGRTERSHQGYGKENRHTQLKKNTPPTFSPGYVRRYGRGADKIDRASIDVGAVRIPYSPHQEDASRKTNGQGTALGPNCPISIHPHPTPIPPQLQPASSSPSPKPRHAMKCSASVTVDTKDGQLDPQSTKDGDCDPPVSRFTKNKNPKSQLFPPPSSCIPHPSPSPRLLPIRSRRRRKRRALWRLVKLHYDAYEFDLDVFSSNTPATKPIASSSSSPSLLNTHHRQVNLTR